MLTTTLMYNKDMSCNFFCLIIYSLRRISKFLKYECSQEKKIREICCDEVFVICPLQNSETPSVNPTPQLPKSCFPFKNVVPF